MSTIERTESKNPFLVMLRLVDGLASADRTTAELMEQHGITGITLKRYIADARHLGAEIVSVKKAGKSYYRLDNYGAIKKRLKRWIELEEQNTLLDCAQGVLIV
jgi:hypothetical protein